MQKLLKKIFGIRTYNKNGATVRTFLGLPIMSKPFDSAAYWEQRYKEGGNSGSGSYGRLAAFKAEFLNTFIIENNIKSVIEFGTGDGHQLSLLHFPQYIGFDVSDTILQHLREQFISDQTKQFFHVRQYIDQKADLVLSLDVIFHLVEDSAFVAYMNSLFNAGQKYIIIYASNRDEYTNVIHVRHHNFIEWIKKNKKDWILLYKVDNKYPYEACSDEKNYSFADFYIFGLKDYDRI